MSFCPPCDAVYDGAKEGLEDLADGAEDLGEAIVDGATELGEKALDVAEVVVTTVGDLTVQIVSDAVALPGVLCEDLARVCDAVGLDVLVTPLSFGANVFFEVADYAGNVVAYVVDGAVIVLDEIGEAVGIAATAIKELMDVAAALATFDSDVLDELSDFGRAVLGGVLRMTLRITEDVLLLAAGATDLLILGPARLTALLLGNVPIVGDILALATNVISDIVYFPLVFAAVLVGAIEVWLCENTNLLNEGPSLTTLLANVVTEPHSHGDRVQILPPPTAQVPYLIISDLHMFYPSTNDFFEENGAPEILNSLFQSFPNAYLIELGDVEDLWRRDVGSSSAGAYTSPSTPTSTRRLLDDIIDSNSDHYSIVRTKYQSKGRYSRVVGNHDIELMDQRVAGALERVYPGLVGNGGVPEFLLIENSKGGYSHVLFHGHQSDVFNKSGCNWFGRSVTQFAGMFHELPLVGDDIRALNVATASDANSWWAEGKKNNTSRNEAPVFGYAQLDEPELYEASRTLADETPYSVMLCCGHSHDAKLNPTYESGPWAYVNSGTAGMAPESIWFVLIDENAGQLRTNLFMAHKVGGQIRYRLYKDQQPSWLQPQAPTAAPVAA